MTWIKPPDDAQGRQPDGRANQTQPLVRHQDLLAYLYSNGHFSEYDDDHFILHQPGWADVRNLQPDDAAVARAIASWQYFRPRLKRDGSFGPICHMTAATEATCRCGLPDVLPREAVSRRWPDACKHQITTSHQLESLRLNLDVDQSLDQAWRRAIELWGQVADLTLIHNNPGTGERVSADARRLGRNILAWSELANGTCDALLAQAYNSQVTWGWRLLWSTICHEIGHAIGIGHGGRAIMQPANDPSVTQLGGWDVDQARRRYGAPQPQPAPEPPTPAPFNHGTLETFDATGRAIATYDVRLSSRS